MNSSGTLDLAAARQLAAEQADARAAASRLADQVRSEFSSRLQWVRLYGSLARGDWLGPEESDVDIALVLQGRSEADTMRVIHLAGVLTTQTGFVFTPLVFSPAEFARLENRELRLARDIRAEGLPL